MGSTTGLSIRVTKTLQDIQLDAIISENHSSTLKVSKFPIETGATITDHAINEPKTYTLRGAVTDVKKFNIFNPTAGFTGNDARTTYEDLVQLQQSREPFDVISGLITYKNLVIERIEAEQDKDSANILIFTAQLSEILIAETQSVNLPRNKLNDNVKDRGASTKDEGRKKPEEGERVDKAKNGSTIYGFSGEPAGAGTVTS